MSALNGFREPEARVVTFNAESWAAKHEAVQELRFSQIETTQDNIVRVLAIAGTVLLAVLGWSLKTQYDGMAAQAQSAQVQLQAIRQLQAQVVPKSPQP